MFSRSKVGAAVFAAGAALLMTTPAQAYDTVSIAPWLDVNPSVSAVSAVGACNFLFSGPSLDPSSSPYHVEGNATIISTKVVVSTSIRCRMKLATTGAQVGGVLRQALPSNSSVVAGDIHVSSFGPFLICTMVNATFSDTTEYNPTEAEQCRPMTRI